jgi:hypothetical protein
MQLNLRGLECLWVWQLVKVAHRRLRMPLRGAIL